MTERSIVEAAARLRRHGEPYLVATVVAVQGAAYRRPGSRMLLTRFRWVAGTVTGGYLEGDLSSTGWSRTKEGAPVLVSYDAATAALAEDDDIRSAFGLGCDGVVDVLIERAGLPGRIDALEVSARCLRAQRRAAVATIFRSTDPTIRLGARLALVEGGELEQESDPVPELVGAPLAADLAAVALAGRPAGHSYATAHGSIEVLIEAMVPPPRLFVIGTGHDAVPIAQLAHQLGWEVVICAREPKVAIRERFTMADEVLIGTAAEITARVDETDRAIVVVMGHDHARDRDAVGMALATGALYIGVLGPRARAQRMLAELGQPDDPRLHAGLELEADTPQDLALALLAEVRTTLQRTPAARPRAHPQDASERPAASRPPAGGAAVVAAT